MQLRLSGLICAAILLTVYAPTLKAVPVTYSYTGAKYTSTGHFNSSTGKSGPSEWFTLEDHVIGSLTVDVPLGTAGQVTVFCHNFLPCTMPIYVGTTRWGGDHTIGYHEYLMDVLSLVFRADLLVDEAGEVLEGTLSVEEIVFGNSIGGGSTDSGAFFQLGPTFESARSTNGGIWAIQAVPEPSSLYSLVLALAAASLLLRKAGTRRR